MGNLEREQTISVSVLAKELHINAPQLFRALNGIEPPIKTSESGRVYKEEIPRIHKAVNDFRKK